MRAGGTLCRLLLLATFCALAACQQQYSRGGIEALGDPVERLPEPRTTYLAQGRGYLQAGNMRLAKAAFIRSIRVEGLSAEALTGAGIAAERQGLLHEAQRYFERALELAPSSEVAHNNLGTVQYRIGEYAAAQRSFQTAFAISSGTSRVARHNLDLVELALKRRAEDEIPVVDNPVPLQREGTSEYRLLTVGTEQEELDG